MEEIIRTDRLTKHYRDVRAVDDISFTVRKGEIYGFLGLNGSGKTTTIRMLLGMIRPTSGSAYLFGEKVGTDSSALWKKAGYLVEIPYSYPELTVRENLEIVRRLRLMPDRNAVDAVADLLHLTHYLDRKTRDLSQGSAQRLGIAKALMHGPEILILDEPSNGLDPAGIVEIRELLRSLALEHGVTIFIASHILGEISRLTTRIGIIHKGKLIQEIDLARLERHLRRRLVVNTLDNRAALPLLERDYSSIAVTHTGHLEIDDARAVDHPEQIAVQLVQAGLPPTSLIVDEENLESYFLRMVDAKEEMP